MLQCPWQGEKETEDRAEHHPGNSASGVICNSIHHDGEGQDVTAHDKDIERKLSPTQDAFAPNAEEYLASAGKGVNTRIVYLKLPDNEAGIGSHGAETDERNQARNDTQLSHSCWKGENSKRNCFGNHDHSSLPPEHALVFNASFDAAGHRVEALFWICNLTFGGNIAAVE